MMNSERIAGHAKAYGQEHSDMLAMAGTDVYDETQCRECPHEHTCCDLMVACGPFEAFGIIHWLKSEKPDSFVGILQTVQMRADLTAGFLESYATDGVLGQEARRKSCDDWYSKRLKCIFYDHRSKNCSIYPVRPMACRRDFGRGDCTAGFRSSAAATPEVEDYRLSRIKITPGGALEQSVELATLISYLAKGAKIGISPKEQELLNTPPELLSTDQRMWGARGAPIQLPNLTGV